MNTKRTLFILLVLIVPGLMAQEIESVKSYSNDCNSGTYKSSELIPFDFNTTCQTEAYPFLTNDGQDLYYTSNRTKNWIFYTHKDEKTGKWKVPVPIEIENFTDGIMSCYVTEDKKTMYFVSASKLYSCQSLNGSLSKFHQLQKFEIISSEGAMSPFSYLSFTSDRQIMYAYLGNSNEVSMAVYSMVSENSYAFQKVVTKSRKEMGFISKDGLTYYYTSDDVPNVLYCKKRNTLAEDFNPTIFIVKTFENHLDIGQISMAEKGRLMAIVLSDETWDNNELFFLDMDLTDSNMVVYNPPVEEADPDNVVMSPAPVRPIQEKIMEPLVEAESRTPVVEKQLNGGSGNIIYKVEIGMAYPNPAKNVFYFYYSIEADKNSSQKATVVLTDMMGREVYSGKLETLKGEARVELQNVAPGTYFIRIDYNGTSSALSKVVIMNN